MKTNFKRSLAASVLAMTLAGGFVTGRATADQPRMQLALDSLRVAKNQLDQATSDKGGHRTKALKYAKLAIAETERGIVYDRRH